MQCMLFQYSFLLYQYSWNKISPLPCCTLPMPNAGLALPKGIPSCWYLSEVSKCVIRLMAMFPISAQLHVRNSAFPVMLKSTYLTWWERGGCVMPSKVSNSVIFRNVEELLVMLYLLMVTFSSSVYGIWAYLCAAI